MPTASTTTGQGSTSGRHPRTTRETETDTTTTDLGEVVDRLQPPSDTTAYYTPATTPGQHPPCDRLRDRARADDTSEPAPCVPVCHPPPPPSPSDEQKPTNERNHLQPALFVHIASQLSGFLRMCRMGTRWLAGAITLVSRSVASRRVIMTLALSARDARRSMRHLSP